MPSAKAGLLLHPLRLQIVTAMASRRMTAKDLADALPGVPQTTLYRHINALVEGGILQVAEETPIRGTVERTYVLAGPPSLKPEDLHGMTKQEYEEAFTIYLSTLMSVAQRYLKNKGEGETFNPLDDGVELSLGELHLSDEEFETMNRKILELLMAAAGNPPAPHRKKRTFTYLFIPLEA